MMSRASSVLSEDTLESALVTALAAVRQEEGGTARFGPNTESILAQFSTEGVLAPDSANTASWEQVAVLLARVTFMTGPGQASVAFAASKLRRAPSQAIDRWLDELLGLLGGAPDNVRKQWEAALGREPCRTIQSKPAGPVHVTQASAAWEVCDCLQLWTEDTVGFDHGTWAPFSLLRRLDLTTWFDAVDRWKDLRFVQSALLFVERHVPASDLLTLLGRAQPCLDDGGAPLPAAGAIVLCQTIQSAAQRLHEQDPDAAHRLLEDFASALLNRVDGVALALALAADLGNRIIGEGQYVPPHLTTLREILIRELRYRRPSVREQRSFFIQRTRAPKGRGGGVRRAEQALLVAAQLVGGQQSDADVDALMAWLVDVLQTDEAWSAWGSCTRELVMAFASAFDGDNAGARERVRMAFASLEFQRRAIQYRHRESDLTFPSMLLLLVLGALCETSQASASEGCFNDLVFGRSQAFRVALTANTVPSATVCPWQVTAIFCVIGCARFGLDDSRTAELLSPVVGSLDVLANVLTRLMPVASGSDLRVWVERQLKRPIAEVIDDAAGARAASTMAPDESIGDWIQAALDPRREVGPPTVS